MKKPSRMFCLFIASIIFCAQKPTLFAAEPISRATIDQEARYIVDQVLAQMYINGKQLPSSWWNNYQSTYETAVRKIADELDSIVKSTSDYVSSDYLEAYVNVTINTWLQSNGTTYVPSSMTQEFQQKWTTVINRLRDSMKYYSNKYVTKIEVDNAVRYEFDTYFINRLKNPSSSTTLLGNLLTSIWSAITSPAPAPTTTIYITQPAQNTPTQIPQASCSTIPSTAMTIYYNDPCVICQQNYFGEERVAALNCGHTFHPECVKQWLKSSKTCPLCRKENAYVAKIYDSKEQVPGYTH